MGDYENSLSSYCSGTETQSIEQFSAEIDTLFEESDQRGAYNSKQITLARIHDELISKFTARKKLVEKITFDENGLAFRLFGYSAHHIESLSEALFCFDDEVNLEEVSVYVLRRKNAYIKGLTIYVKLKSKDEKKKVIEICEHYNLKITFLCNKK
jgi:hypothetical protein